jgi:hypothetical protein
MTLNFDEKNYKSDEYFFFSYEKRILLNNKFTFRLEVLCGMIFVF